MPKAAEESSHPFVTTALPACIRAIGFYPFDTAGKRIQQSNIPVRNFTTFNQALFGQHVQSSLLYKTSLLYRGLIPWGGAYKVVQLVSLGYLRPLQEKIRKELKHHDVIADVSSSFFLASIQTLLLQALNNIKVETQARTLPEDRRQRLPALVERFTNPSYYVKNAKVTYFRNLLFLSTTAIFTFPVQKILMYANQHDKPTPTEKAAASVICATLGILVTAPLDVIKTRMQLLPLNVKREIIPMATKIYKKEGVRAFAKGLIPNTFPEVVGLVVFFSLQSFFKANDTAEVRQKHGFFAIKEEEKPSPTASPPPGIKP